MKRISLLMALLLLSACARADESEDASQAADSAAAVGTIAPPPPAGPTAGEQVAVTLTEWAVQLSRPEVRRGTLSFSIANRGTMTHEFEVEGKSGEWKSTPIPPGQTVLMSIVLEPGEYEVYCPIEDSTGSHKAKGMTTKLVVTS